MEALPMPHIRCLVEVSPNPKLCRIVWSVFAAAEMHFSQRLCKRRYIHPYLVWIASVEYDSLPLVDSERPISLPCPGRICEHSMVLR